MQEGISEARNACLSYPVNRHLTADFENGHDAVNFNRSYLAGDNILAIYRKVIGPGKIAG